MRGMADEAVIAAMRGKPAEEAWTKRELRAAIGCSERRLNEAIGRLRYHGKIEWDALRLSESMREEDEPEPEEETEPEATEERAAEEPRSGGPKIYARADYAAATRLRTEVRQLLEPWCRRTGTPLGTAAQFLFGNARALDGSSNGLAGVPRQGPGRAKAKLPADAAAMARQLMLDRPNGIDPREAAAASGDGSYGDRDGRREGGRRGALRRNDRATHACSARGLPRAQGEPGGELQALALEDPKDAVEWARRAWPELFGRVIEMGRREGKRPFPMLRELIESGLEARDA